MSLCRGCGVELAPNKAPGPRRKWCSDNCRKRTPEFRAAEREYNKTSVVRTGLCAICGGLKGSQCKRYEICRACVVRGKEAKREEIQQLWLSGASLRQIRAELGITRGYLAVEIHRMREEGWDLPYRYAKRNGVRVAA